MVQVLLWNHKITQYENAPQKKQQEQQPTLKARDQHLPKTL